MKRLLLIFSLIASVAFLGACDDGNDGAPGPTGPAGPAGPEGPAGPPGQDLTATLEPESCSVCHSKAGAEHQVVYNSYSDKSTLDLEILEVKSVAAGGGTFNVTMTFSIMKDGLPYEDANDLRGLAEKRFTIQGYDSATRTFPNAMNVSMGSSAAVAGQPGVYTVTATGVSYAPENSNAYAYGYVASGHLDVEEGDHIHLYEDVDNAALVFGDVGDYDSYADVDGCELCHGEPYLKHGYRAAEVAGLPTFVACKTCHMDDRGGSHEDWQQMVDDPVGWGNDESPKKPEYAYTRRLMNDVHMSHAMEFPYPQSMANCGATCHKGELEHVTSDEFFVATTCKSCHPVQTRPAEYRDDHRAPSLQEIWDAEGVTFHKIDDDCQGCHTASGIADTFAELHTGFDPVMYNANGQKYSELYTANITSLSLADGVLDIRFTANTALMTAPTALISFYGYDTKQFIVSAHTRNADRQNLELTIGTANPYITEAADSVQGNWHLTFTLDDYDLSPLQEMIDDGVIKRLEVSIRANLAIDGLTVATNAPSKTLDIASNTIDADYFKGANAVVKVVDGCNNCHDELGPTFHGGGYGGNITMCKNCHFPGSGGSHLEMQSREIASYVHAIHQFQAFDAGRTLDRGGIDFSDKYFAKKYCEHVGTGENSVCLENGWDYIGFVFPNFTIKNCEACHNPGTYNVPDQAGSLPAVLSSSFDDNPTWDRKIAGVPSYVTGPASKACGACHRTHLINEDDASGLTSFFQHTKQGGYLVEDAETPWDQVVAEIMALFE